MLQQKISLKPFNTLGIEVFANHFLSLQTLDVLYDLMKDKIYSSSPKLILGGGSNILFTKDFDGLVLKNEIKGKEIIKKEKNMVEIKVKGGENWHEFVLWCLAQNFGGIENLSLIPGTVGAAPIQNIGAYGVELKDVFVCLNAIDLETGKLSIFKKEDCQFGYRDSIFKKKYKNQYLIESITIRLTHQNHQIKATYGAIKTTLAAMEIEKPTIQNISDAVIAIRSSKLPNPKVLGNAGSFFKNPEIDKKQFAVLKQQFPNIIFYDLPNNQVKIPAGWLIEQCGWKGKVVGNTGSHAKQALVLVNYGAATGKEIVVLAYAIIDSVQKKFGIQLTPEVNIL